jgi:hypothetical protein
LKPALFLHFDEATLCFGSSSTPLEASSRPSLHALLFPHCTFPNFNLICLSADGNPKRLSSMFAQARYDERKENMLSVKNLYVSRHYTQCAKLGERLLSEADNEVRRKVIFVYHMTQDGRRSKDVGTI